MRESPRRRSPSPRAAHARPSPRAPRPHAPRSQLRRRLPGWHLRAGSAASQAPGSLFTRLLKGRPPRCLTGPAPVPGSLRLSAERRTVAKLGYGCRAAQRAVFMGEEPGTSQGSHFYVQAPVRADPEEELLPPRRAARAGMCCGERRRGNGRRGGGEDGVAEGSNRARERECVPDLQDLVPWPGPQIPVCLASVRVSCGVRPEANKINKIKLINRNHFSSITKWNPWVSFLPLFRGPAARAAALPRSGRGV